MTQLPELSVTVAFITSVIAGLLFCSFFIYFGARALQVEVKSKLGRSLLCAALIALANALIYPASAEDINPIKHLAIILLSFFTIKFIFQITFRKAALLLMFSAFAQITSVAIIPMLAYTKAEFLNL